MAASITSSPPLPPSRAEALEPVCNYLLDAVEALNGAGDTAWAAEPYTPNERATTLEAVRAVTHMMETYAMTFPRPFDDGAA